MNSYNTKAQHSYRLICNIVKILRFINDRHGLGNLYEFNYELKVLNLSYCWIDNKSSIDTQNEKKNWKVKENGNACNLWADENGSIIVEYIPIIYQDKK